MENTIGLEAEYFLRDKDGNLLIPSEKGFDTDEYILLGEFRGDKGHTRHETLANFFEKYWEIYYKVMSKGLVMDVSTGWTTLTPEFHAEVMRKMGTKYISQCKNIHDIDMLSLTDKVIKNGKIKEVKASIGLHVHFGSMDISERSQYEVSYSPIRLPISVQSDAVFNIELYKKLIKKLEEKHQKPHTGGARVI